ncbi:hypothetical protein D9M68_947670 [compost metagenome]
MPSLVESILTRVEQNFTAFIGKNDSPEEFAEEMRTRLDQDMCSELFCEDGLCKITDAEWGSALDQIYQRVYEFACKRQEPTLLLG